MATLVMFALCRAAVAPWWTLWLSLAFDTVATAGITVAIVAVGQRPPGVDQQLGSSVEPSSREREQGQRIGFEELIGAALHQLAEVEKREANPPATEPAQGN